MATPKYITNYEPLTHVERVDKLLTNIKNKKLSDSEIIGISEVYPYVYNAVVKKIENNSKSQAVNYHKIEADVNAYLQAVKMEKINTGSDGNCFFYAVQGYGEIKGIPELSIPVCFMREAVAQTIETDEEGIYRPLFESASKLHEHARNIRKCQDIGETNTWADEIDINAFSRHYGVCIVIHDWRKTNPPPYHVGTISYPKNCDLGRNRNPKCINILRTGENHFSLLMRQVDPHYSKLKIEESKQKKEIRLPLSVSGLDLRNYHPESIQNVDNAVVNFGHAAESNSPRPLPEYANAAARNFNKLSLYPAARSALNSAQPFNLASIPIEQQRAMLNNAERQRAAQAAAANNGRAAQAAASSSNETYIAKLRNQIRKLKKSIHKWSDEETNPEIEKNIKKATEQLEKRYRIAKNLGLKFGGTQKRKTQKRRTRHNKNKSRRRL